MPYQSKPPVDSNDLKKLINDGSMIYQVEDTPLYVGFITINSNQLLLSLPDKNQLYENFAQESQLDPQVIAKQAEEMARVLTQEIESDKEILAAIHQGVESLVSQELPSLARRLLAVSQASDQANIQMSALTALKQELEDWLNEAVQVQIRSAANFV